MSNAHDSHDAGAAAHDAHAHTFDGEPTKELAAGEPQTPGWIPAVGAALFLAGGVAFLAATSESSAADGSPAATQEAAAAAPSPPVPPAAPVLAPTRPRPPAVAAPASPAPSVSGLAAMTPEQRDLVMKRVKELRAKNGGKPAGSP